MKAKGSQDFLNNHNDRDDDCGDDSGGSCRLLLACLPGWLAGWLVGWLVVRTLPLTVGVQQVCRVRVQWGVVEQK